MITLFVIVVIATIVLAVTRAEGMRPLGLALVGMISLVLGVRATAVFTETSIAPLVTSMVVAQENTGATSSAAATDEPAETLTTERPKSTVPSGGEAAADPASDDPASDDPASDDPASDDPASDESASDDPASDESASDESASDESASDESASDESASDDPASDDAPPLAEAEHAESTEATSGAAEATTNSPALASPITVEAITNVKYLDRGEGTPSWLETKPWTENGVHFVPVVSRLQISEKDRDGALTREIDEATDAYINEFLKNKHATTLLTMQSASTIPRVTESFQEQVVVTAGTMYQSHALLAFDDDFHDAVTAEWDKVRAASRLMQTGLGAGIVILLLSTMFSYFKLDTATRGYYTGRLQFIAAAAILTVIAVSVLFANYVPWM